MMVMAFASMLQTWLLANIAPRTMHNRNGLHVLPVTGARRFGQISIALKSLIAMVRARQKGWYNFHNGLFVWIIWILCSALGQPFRNISRCNTNGWQCI
jgi:hypothetical protein